MSLQKLLNVCVTVREREYRTMREFSIENNNQKSKLNFMSYKKLLKYLNQNFEGLTRINYKNKANNIINKTIKIKTI